MEEELLGVAMTSTRSPVSDEGGEEEGEEEGRGEREREGEKARARV